jgi:hypothetical protein
MERGAFTTLLPIDKLPMGFEETHKLKNQLNVLKSQNKQLIKALKMQSEHGNAKSHRHKHPIQSAIIPENNPISGMFPILGNMYAQQQAFSNFMRNPNWNVGRNRRPAYSYQPSMKSSRVSHQENSEESESEESEEHSESQSSEEESVIVPTPKHKKLKNQKSPIQRKPQR